jgi:hypothetical protein
LQLFEEQRRTFWAAFWCGYGAGLQFCMFNVSHFLLADKYWTMVRTVPAKLEGRVPEEKNTFQVIIYWTLLVLNTVLPLSTGYCIYLLRYQVVVEGRTEAKSLETIQTLLTVLSTSLQVLSGVTLVATVAKIHSYFKSKDSEDAIDTKMLMIYALAFGIYTISVVVYVISWVVMLYTQNDRALHAWASLILWPCQLFVRTSPMRHFLDSHSENQRYGGRDGSYNYFASGGLGRRCRDAFTHLEWSSKVVR